MSGPTDDAAPLGALTEDAEGAQASEEPMPGEPTPEEPTPGEAAAHSEPLPSVSLEAVLEALLLVTDEPVPTLTLAQVAGQPTELVERVLRALVEGYEQRGSGVELRQVAGGWRLYTRADCAPYIERFLLDGQQARLTQAALETLAVIAYRQPVTRSRVSAVRGVNVDGVVRTLLARGLVADAGQDQDSAATLYRTTPLFLERLGLLSLDDLPALAPLLPELDELDDASTLT